MGVMLRSGSGGGSGSLARIPPLFVESLGLRAALILRNESGTWHGYPRRAKADHPKGVLGDGRVTPATGSNPFCEKKGVPYTIKADPGQHQSRSAVAPPPNLSLTKSPVSKPSSRSYLLKCGCPSTPRRHRSMDICTRENMWILFFQ